MFIFNNNLSQANFNDYSKTKIISISFIRGLLKHCFFFQLDLILRVVLNYKPAKLVYYGLKIFKHYDSLSRSLVKKLLFHLLLFKENTNNCFHTKKLVS